MALVMDDRLLSCDNHGGLRRHRVLTPYLDCYAITYEVLVPLCTLVTLEERKTCVIYVPIKMAQLAITLLTAHWVEHLSGLWKILGSTAISFDPDFSCPKIVTR